MNLLPQARQTIVQINVPISDFTYHSLSLTDCNGQPLTSQQIETISRVQEPKYLVEADIPPCGYRIIKFKWEKDEPDMVQSSLGKVPAKTTVKSDCMEIIFQNGHLRRINDFSKGKSFKAAGQGGFLDPVALWLDGEEWYPQRLISELNEFQVNSFAVLENGPLRWRIERRGRIGQHEFRQYINLLKGKSIIEATTEYLAAQDGNSYYIGIGLPLPQEVTLQADIPFGVESRNVSQTPYGKLTDIKMFSLERNIPGLFYARSWVSASFNNSGLTLLATDGDRYFYHSKSSSILAHILCKTMVRLEKGWPVKSMLGLEGGWQKFHHVLVLQDTNNIQEANIVQLAQEYRYPISTHFVAPGKHKEGHSFLSIKPDTVRMSALYQEGEALVMRIVQMDSQEKSAEIHLPFTPEEVIMVDFEGNNIQASILISANTIKLKLLPWQICNLKIMGRTK
jgi:alpha-mannosidase